MAVTFFRYITVLTQRCQPTEEEEKIIIQNWKSSWDAKILGPSSVKSQLKAVLFSQQYVNKLETFTKNLLMTLHERAKGKKEKKRHRGKDDEDVD